MIDYSMLTSAERILLSLLETHTCTIRQLTEFLDVSTEQYTSRLLSKLKKSKFINFTSCNDSRSFNAYYITQRGFDYICSKTGLFPYKPSGVTIINIYEKALRVPNQRTIEHNISISDFYYILAKEFGFGNFSWEKEMAVDIDDDNYSAVIGDAIFALNNRSYILEQDMGTETKTHLEKKFIAYSKTLADNSTYPIILFSINMKLNLPRHITYTDLDGYEELMQLNRKLKKRLKELNKNLLLLGCDPDKTVYYPDIDPNELDLLLSLINKYKKPILIYNQKIESSINSIIDKLKEIKQSNDTNADKKTLFDEIIITKKQIQQNTDVINQLKEDYTRKRIHNKNQNRIEAIMNIAPTITEFKRLMLSGLDFYINSQNNMKTYLKKLCLMKINHKDYVMNVLRSLFNNNKYSYELKNKIRFMAGNLYEDIVLKRCFTVRSVISPNAITFAIEDISYNNYAAKLRIEAYCNYVPANEIQNNVIVLICDNANQIREMNADFNRISRNLIMIEADEIENILINNPDKEQINNLKLKVMLNNQIETVPLDYIYRYLERW